MGSRRQNGRRLALALLSAVAVIASHAIVGCDDAYEPPCRVTRREVLIEDPAISAGNEITLDRSGDHVAASWQRREAADAGADASSGPPPIVALETAVVDAVGALRGRASVPTPESLRARKGSVESIGVVVEDDAFLVHWVETTTTTDPDGRTRKAAALQAAYVAGGVTSQLTLPASTACEHCSLATAFVALGSASVAILRIDPDVVEAPIGTPVAPGFTTLRFRRDSAVTDEATPWLGLPQSPSTGQPVRVFPERLSAYVNAEGLVVLLADARAWLADASLQLVSGPIALPSAPDARVSWQRTGEASLAWSVSPSSEGRVAGADSQREIFTGLVPVGTSAVATRERASRGRRALGFDRRGDDVGTLFESAGRTFFAWLDPQGRKRGGDLLISSSSAEIRSPSDYGFPPVTDEHVLFARGAGRFTAVTLGSGKLVASEILCAP